jgi:hypothetical protein
MISLFLGNTLEHSGVMGRVSAQQQQLAYDSHDDGCDGHWQWIEVYLEPDDDHGDR